MTRSKRSLYTFDTTCKSIINCYHVYVRSTYVHTCSSFVREVEMKLIKPFSIILHLSPHIFIYPLP